MLGSPAAPAGASQRGQWPSIAPAPPCANAFTADGFNKYGVYSLFPGGPSFGSALYTHASTIGRFTSSHIQQPSGNPFHAAHKEALFSSGYTFGALTPPPGSPYSPVPVSQLELLAKSFNSNIIIQQQADYPLSPKKAPQIQEKRCDEKCCNFRLQRPCDCDLISVSAKHGKSISDNSGRYGGDFNQEKYEGLLKFSDNNNSSGCSRTNPLDWNGVNVKKEPGTPCQVAEVSTSASPQIKVEVTSPTQRHPNGQVGLMSNVVANTNGSNIPVGVAVARQRVQQNEVISSPSLPPAGLLTTVNHTTAQVKEVARISEIDSTSSPIGMAAASTVGGPAGGTVLHCTDDRTGSLAGWAIGGTHGSALSATPTLWQYPASVPMEPMVPLPLPPVGLQLVREPTTGGFLLLPTTTGIESLQQAVVWPSYHQPSSVFLPPIPPPPLQLLSSSSDYLQSSTTLHQHTQTHSTRLLAVTTDSKRKIPLPIPATALIKIEADATNIDPAKALQTVSTIGTNTGAVFGDQNMPPLLTTHVIYQHPTNVILSQPPVNEFCKSRATSPACLTPPPESVLIQEEEPLTVQDASNQTDTPICSEDDNTTHTISDVIGEAKIKGLEESEPIIDSFIKEDIVSQTPVESDKDIEVASANITDPAPVEKIVPESSCKDDELQDQEPIVESTVENDLIENSIEESPVESENTHDENFVSSQSAPDISGLELLSNSIVEFENCRQNSVTEEESESQTTCSDSLVESTTSTISDEPIVQQNPLQSITKTVEENHFGGLDLLCALAEQRILEEKSEKPQEKEPSKERKRDKRKSRRHHDEPKHKKYKHDRSLVSEEVQTESEPLEMTKMCKCQEENLHSYRNPKSAQEVKKFIASKSQSSCDDDWPNMNAMELDMRMKLADLQRQYREKQKELSKLKPKKHSHECSKKRLRKKSTNSDRSLTPPPVLEKITIPLKPNKAPDLIKPPILRAFGEVTPKLNLDKGEEKSQDEPESSPERSASKKRKVGRPKKLLSSPGLHVTTETIVAKKPKKGNFVGYFLAAKEKYQTQQRLYSNSPPRYIEDVTTKPKVRKTKNNNTIYEDYAKSCKIRPKLKAEPTIKSNKDDEEEDIGEIEVVDEDYNEVDMDLEESIVKHCDEIASEGNIQENEDTMEEVTAEEDKVDTRCTLTAEHLEVDRLRVLTAMGGLFYAGRLNAVEPPDVYSITLDGERGNRPHIMSREEILRDAIVEISPKATEELTVGTRICAYWSQQYRCLYPGSVAEPGTPDPALDSKFVSVEFDDGDSGRIALEDIRLLPPNYPIIEYDPNPLQSLSKRRRRVSTSVSIASIEEKPKLQSSTAHESSKQMEIDTKKENKDLNRPDIDAHKERKRLKKMKKEKLRRKLQHDDKKKRRKHKCTEENCKHKKHHKKHRKHRKHHHSNKDELVETVECFENKSEENALVEENSFEEETEEDSVEQEISVEIDPSVEDEDITTTSEDQDSQDSIDPDFEVGNPDCEVTIDDVSEHKKSKKVRDRQESCDSRSKISAFLPAHLMWDWVGKEYKIVKGKGRYRKAFYRSIKRDKGEMISVGDAAVFKSTGRPDRPYIGRIETMWECSNSMVVRVKWFYHPEETENESLNLKFPGALFESPHVDENDVQTISHKCNVVPFSKYYKKFGDNLASYRHIYENNDMYYLAGHYDPTTKVLRMEPGIPQSS